MALASYLNTAFSDEEREEIMPIDALYSMLYIAALRGGTEAVVPLSVALDLGLNDFMKATTQGTMKAQVSVSLMPSQEHMQEFGTKLGEAVAKRMQEKLREQFGDIE